MSTDKSSARCSFCGRYSYEVQRMIAGPGAANICDECLQLCDDILKDTTPFSAQALELASRPPIVVAAPSHERFVSRSAGEPLRSLTLKMEQKQYDKTLILHQMHFFQEHFELRYLWMRPPFQSGFSFVPRIIFALQDSTGTRWNGERSGMLLARPELASGTSHMVYQGSARFQPLPSPDARTLTIQAVDPLAAFEDTSIHPWQFDVTLQVI